MSEPKLSEDLQGELGQRLAAGQHAAWREAIQRSEALEARLSKMGALRNYAQHRIGCGTFSGGLCDCGLDKTIDALPERLKKGEGNNDG